jgi:hypothetical protein
MLLYREQFLGKFCGECRKYGCPFQNGSNPPTNLHLFAHVAAVGHHTSSGRKRKGFVGD